MKPPSLAPECPRGHAVGSSPDRRLVAVGLVIVVTPFLLGVVGSVMIADEAIGPLITLAFWVAVLVVNLVCAKGAVSWIECLPVIGCLLVLQLLLDLHTPHLGDLVIAGLHAPMFVAMLVAALAGAIRKRRAR
ncbi:MAG: hypothetical protein M4D80_09525 [Myxococcota bacterium]|nr:hypothetical protein [Myxococcota bacterium]